MARSNITLSDQTTNYNELKSLTTLENQILKRNLNKCKVHWSLWLVRTILIKIVCKIGIGQNGSVALNNTIHVS